MPVEYYEVSKIKLVTAAGFPAILEELCGHQVIGSSKLIWPEQFFIRVDLDTDDDNNGLQYFSELRAEKSFLNMGFSDTGFYLVVALFRTLGIRCVTP
jgi:hypothetical protein